MRIDINEIEKRLKIWKKRIDGKKWRIFRKIKWNNKKKVECDEMECREFDVRKEVGDKWLINDWWKVENIIVN